MIELPKDRDGLNNLRVTLIRDVQDITKTLRDHGTSAAEQERLTGERSDLEAEIARINAALARFKPAVSREDILSPRQRAAVDVTIALIQSPHLDRFVKGMSSKTYDAIEDVTTVAWDFVDSIVPREGDDEDDEES